MKKLPRPASLSELRRDSEPPRHGPSFRPTEVLRDMYIGGAADCKNVLLLSRQTGCRLIVRALGLPRAAPFEIHSYERGAEAVPPTRSELSPPPRLAPSLQRFDKYDAFIAALQSQLVQEGDERSAACFGVGIVTLHGALDDAGYPMSQHWHMTTAAIHTVWVTHLRPVVVFCAAGVSRSVSVVAAFIVAYCAADSSLTVEAVIALLRRRRFQASPNSGFTSQLRDWAAAAALLAQRSA